jgi:TonB family protein
MALAAPTGVLHEEIPEVSRNARASIRGRIKVMVRVAVDRSGRVVKETLESSGSSRYFAHVASEAAKKWKFAPAENPDSRVWLLQFEFTRGGVTGHATPRT